MRFLILLFLTSNLVFSQEEVKFLSRYQEYIKGDLTFIANNILNRNDNNNINESYNKLGKKSSLNDEFDMQYIDVDNDATTFSSSSATFNSKNKNDEIVFAGLYWSATYNYPKGIKTKKTFEHEGERDADFNKIKIRIPTSKEYQDITGTVIFDGFSNYKYKENAPYVCFYDLTKLVKKNPNGEYTIANIRATEGKIEGGSSAGWVLYFVYKNELESAKYISLFDGFASVYDKPVEISFLNFLTPETGDINCKMAMSVLEGDTKIDGDHVRIKNESKNKYFYLETENRAEHNFFNSQITIENEPFLARNPASENTLGFDALLCTIKNNKNNIITNNATQTTIKIGSNGDKYYLFTTGFTTNIDETFYNTNKKVEIIETIVEKPMEEITTVKKKKTKIKNSKTNKKSIKPTIVETPVETFENKKIVSKEPTKFKTENNNRKPFQIRVQNTKTDLKLGYYLVCNVFAIDQNKKNYQEFLMQNNVKSDSFLNSDNKYQYVYLKFTENLEEITNIYNSNFNNTFFDDYWILNVTLPEQKTP
jgi:hypothetical protein